jgi:hypothetical protein
MPESSMSQFWHIWTHSRGPPWIFHWLAHPDSPGTSNTQQTRTTELFITANSLSYSYCGCRRTAPNLPPHNLRPHWPGRLPRTLLALRVPKANGRLAGVRMPASVLSTQKRTQPPNGGGDRARAVAVAHPGGAAAARFDSSPAPAYAGGLLGSQADDYRYWPFTSCNSAPRSAVGSLGARGKSRLGLGWGLGGGSWLGSWLGVGGELDSRWLFGVSRRGAVHRTQRRRSG